MPDVIPVLMSRTRRPGMSQHVALLYNPNAEIILLPRCFHCYMKTRRCLCQHVGNPTKNMACCWDNCVMFVAWEVVKALKKKNKETKASLSAGIVCTITNYLQVRIKDFWRAISKTIAAKWTRYYVSPHKWTWWVLRSSLDGRDLRCGEAKQRWQLL